MQRKKYSISHCRTHIYTVKRLHWDRLWIIFIFFALTLSYLNVENSLKECKEWQVSLKINSLKMRHEMSSKEFNLIDKIYEKSTVDINVCFLSSKSCLRVITNVGEYHNKL